MNQLLKKKVKKPKTISELSKRIKEVMVKHIGERKGIEKLELFSKIFGNPDKYNEIQVWWLWDKIRKQMNWLRRTSNCFIASRQAVPGIWKYFVIKCYRDANFYIDNLNRNMKKMKSMQKKAAKYTEDGKWMDFVEEMKE